jgi:hypothetical protein
MATRPSAIAVDGTNVYWADSGNPPYPTGSIWRLAPGEMPLELAPQQTNPLGIAVDSTHVFWTTGVDSPSGGVWSVPITGGTATLVVQANAACVGIALTTNEVVWGQGTFQGSSALQRAPKQGGVPTTITSTPSPVSGMAIDGQSVFWTDSQSPGGHVYRSDLAGAGGPTDLAGYQSSPIGIVRTSGTLFWANRGGLSNDAGAIVTMPDDGGAMALATGLAASMRLAVDATDVYFCEMGEYDGFTGAIGRVARSGGPVTRLATQQGMPVGIAVDDKAVYWVNQSGGEVMRLAK